MQTETGGPAQTEAETISDLKKPEEAPGFSLVLGGPLYQLFLRAHLSGTALELVKLRILVAVALTWLPLLILSAAGGRLFDGSGLPFLRDIEIHVRYLICVPVIILAELLVHRRLRPVVGNFASRGIVRPEDTPRFQAAIESAMRLRNSIPLEIGLLVFTYTVGRWLWQRNLALDAPSWYGMRDAAGIHFTLAGYWLGFVSAPIGQFLLLRWYMRLAIWARFLWQVSRLNLRFQALHPDGAGGVGFLGKSTYAFGPLLFAQGATLAGFIASRVLFHGQSLTSFKTSVVGLILFFVIVILGPLLFFAPALAQTKRLGLNKYGALATGYVTGFDEKWMEGKEQDEGLLGTADIQSLADLANSYGVVRDMRAVPFGLNDVKNLVVATAAPLLPLLLIIMPLEELLDRLVKLVF